MMMARRRTVVDDAKEDATFDGKETPVTPVPLCGMMDWFRASGWKIAAGNIIFALIVAGVGVGPIGSATTRRRCGAV